MATVDCRACRIYLGLIPDSECSCGEECHSKPRTNRFKFAELRGELKEKLKIAGNITPNIAIQKENDITFKQYARLFLMQKEVTEEKEEEE